jgi:RHS repeat-associated protein
LNVSFYPAEYNSYALGGAPITWRTDSAGNWRKEYKLFDHLGSVRTVLRKDESSTGYEYREQISYKPFGEIKDRLYCTDNTTPDARLKYIGKQLDFVLRQVQQPRLADHGVRKYDNSLGMFTSIDPLWEKYYGWTPYHYCRNNPLMAVDPSGFADYINDKGLLIGCDDNEEDRTEYYTTEAEYDDASKSSEWNAWDAVRKNQRPNADSRTIIEMLVGKSEQTSNRVEHALIEDDMGGVEFGSGNYGSFHIDQLIKKTYDKKHAPWIVFHTHMLESTYNVGGGAPTNSDQPSSSNGDGNSDYEIYSKMSLERSSIIYDPNHDNIIFYNSTNVTFKIPISVFLK